LNSLKDLQASESGVSLDEEAANLINAQKSYEACARVLTTIDEMLDKLINGTGLVGR
jgi:flagellar hook-associated protein 1 FlgK